MVLPIISCVVISYWQLGSDDERLFCEKIVNFFSL